MVSIPEDVFTKYHEFADEMITSFGVDCSIHYVKKISVSEADVGNINISKSLRPFDKRKEFKQSTSYSTTETSENIKLRVYWDRKSFKKISDLVIPDGGIMTIGYLTDLPKIRSCEYMKPNISNEAYLGYKFERTDNPIPWGIRKDRYFVCGWKQV